MKDSLWNGWGGHLAWDLGAHIGESIPVLLELGFDRIDCFEPSAESFSALALEHVFNPQVKLHRLAISDHDGTMDLSVRENCIQTGQLVAPGMPYEDDTPGTASDEESLLWGKNLGARTVLCRSIDSLSRDLSVPDFCYVSTMGGEVDVLRGARRVLAFGVTGFLLEFYTEDRYHDCVKILEEAGYTPEMTGHFRNHGWIRATAPRGNEVASAESM